MAPGQLIRLNDRMMFRKGGDVYVGRMLEHTESEVVELRLSGRVVKVRSESHMKCRMISGIHRS